MEMKKSYTLVVNRLMTSIVFVLLVYGFWYSICKAEFNQSMFQRALGRGNENFDSEYLFAVDRFYRTNFPDGNVFILFEGLNADVDGNFLFVQFMRASYTLYPRRAYVAVPGVILRTSEDILVHNALPESDWLHANNVNYVLTFRHRNGKRDFDIQTVRE